MLTKKLLTSLLLILCSTIAFAGMGGGGMGGGTSVIDPPVGAAFKDPVEMPYLNGNLPGTGTVEVNLEVKKAKINVNGTNANLLTFNGYYPGPTIRVKKGDILKVHYKNSLPDSMTGETNMLGYQRGFTNLHTHGFHVSPEGMSDMVMYEIGPGETHEHEYDTSLQEAGTMCFYHPHIHGTSAEQYWAGIAGALITADDSNVLAGFETHLMIIKDITLNGTEPAPHSMMMDYMHGKEGNIVMINGQVNPYLNIKKGQVQRWRILNATNARFLKLSLDSHSLQLIGTDGGLLDKPYQQSYLLLSPGERVDVLVKGTLSSGNYKFKALPYSRMGMMGGQTITLATVKYISGSLNQTLPSVINPDAVRIDPDMIANMMPEMMGPDRSLTLSMGQGNGYINGQDFDVNPYTIMLTLGTYEKWTIYNQSGMDHPFHQHVNAGQIISVTGGDAGYKSLYTSIPAWKDTVLVPKMGSVTILIPIMDFKGMAMFHCHILEHEDIGMMGMWHIMDGMMPMGGAPEKSVVSKSDKPQNALLQNYPSPFNPETWIPFQLAEDVDVKIKIYNSVGSLVRSLDLGKKPAGYYTNKGKAAYWDGKNEAGEHVANGLYFYTIKAGDFTDTRKMTMLK